MQPARIFVGLLFLVLCAAFSAAVSGQTPSGMLRGTVQDINGARVVGATVSISDAEKSYSRKIRSDERGEFRVADLPPDTYEVGVAANGFAEVRAKVTVAVSSVREITITLKPERINEKVVILDGNQSITSANLDTSSAVHQAVPVRITWARLAARW
jgi:hypothetical protein